MSGKDGNCKPFDIVLHSSHRSLEHVLLYFLFKIGHATDHRGTLELALEQS